MLSIIAATTSCFMNRGCLRLGLFWKRGFFFTGSSSPKHGEHVWFSGFMSATKINGLKMDLNRKKKPKLDSFVMLLKMFLYRIFMYTFTIHFNRNTDTHCTFMLLYNQPIMEQPYIWSFSTLQLSCFVESIVVFCVSSSSRFDVLGILKCFSA